MRRMMCVVAVLFASSTSFAQDEDVRVEPDVVKRQKATYIDFGIVQIEGTLIRPEGSYLIERRRARFRNLIALRGNFRPELQRSAY